MRLISIVKSVIFLGIQNISLPGRRDDGILLTTSFINDGLFRELLIFRVKSSDGVVENRLKNTYSKATYINITKRNKIIERCSNVILKHILSRITKDSGFYSTVFDETLDVSKRSQIRLVLRFLGSITGWPLSSYYSVINEIHYHRIFLL